jgi:hypothetical protein
MKVSDIYPPPRHRGAEDFAGVRVGNADVSSSPVVDLDVSMKWIELIEAVAGRRPPASGGPSSQALTFVQEGGLRELVHPR